MSARYKSIAKLFRDNASNNFSVEPATIEEIEFAEKELKVQLPESYKMFQLEFGNYDWGYFDIYSVVTPQDEMINIIDITRSEQNEAHPKMPLHLIPFSDNGGGDSYCFDTSNYENKECSIVFWDHESDENQLPENVAKDFLEWLEKEIKWRLIEDENNT